MVRYNNNNPFIDVNYRELVDITRHLHHFLYAKYFSSENVLLKNTQLEKQTLYPVFYFLQLVKQLLF